MAWDLGLNEHGDLSGEIVTKRDEIAQRVLNRLRRELGEWFLATDSGVPWYGNSEEGFQGILGTNMKRRDSVDLILRTVILGTDGVKSIKKFNSLIDYSTRKYSVYFSIVTEYGVTDGTFAYSGS